MKAFALVLTIIIVSIFSLLSTTMLQNSSLTLINSKNLLHYTQAKIHADFIQNELNELNITSLNKKLVFEDDDFNIWAEVKENNSTSLYIDLFIKSKFEDISYHRSFIKKF